MASTYPPESEPQAVLSADAIDLLGRVAEIRRILRSLRRRVAGLDDCIGDFDSLLEQLERWLRRKPIPPLPRRLKQRIPRARLPSGPAAVVSSFDVVRQRHGWGVACIDGKTQVQLQPALADLLCVLAEDDSPSPDDLVCWKTKSALLFVLGKRGGRKKTDRALAQSLYLLRRELEEAGLPRGLIQHKAGLGWRLALRRVTTAG